MSVSPDSARLSPALRGSEGELVAVQIRVEPRLLERVLDVLAHLDFPINPCIRHAGGPVTAVEFPAWSARLERVREALAQGGFLPDCLAVRSMIEEIRADAGFQVPATA